MELNSTTYQQIQIACERRQNTQFDVERSATAFAEVQAPVVWTAYPPALLSKKDYAQVFHYAGSDSKGVVTKLELKVYLDGGRIEYQECGADLVSLRITWPQVEKT